MTTQEYADRQVFNTKLIVALFAAMILAFAFVAIITNMIVSSKVNALAAAQQYNPVTVAAPVQTNTAPTPTGACVLPANANGDDAAGTTSAAAGGSYTLPWNYTYGTAPLTYNQSNSSVITTTSNNTFTEDSYNSNSNSFSSVLITDNGNTDNRFSGNTYTDNRNSGNTTTTTVTTAVDNSNNSTNTNIQDSGNTLTSIVDNSVENNAIAVGGVALNL